MKIEIADINQLNSIFEIFVECRIAMEKENIFQWTEQYPTLEIITQDINTGNLFSLNQDQKILGVININSIEEPEYKTINWADTNGQIMVIHRLAIHPKWQRQGLARSLMDFAEDFAAKKGCSSIRLDAYSGNERALQLYENRDYIKRGEVNFPGRELPFYCFEKQIKNNV